MLMNVVYPQFSHNRRMLSITTLQAQSVSLEQEISDFSEKSWKEGSVRTQIFADERAMSLNALSDNTLHPDDVRIRTVYIDLLNRMETLVDGGMPVFKAAIVANEQALTSGITPDSKNIQPETLHPLVRDFLFRLEQE
jgi:hypothetical protein